MDDRPIPSSFGEYTITKVIGSGATSLVAVACHQSTRAQYAVKMIPYSASVPPATRCAVDREIRIMRKMNNPHIVKLFDVVYARNYAFLVMEYCSQGSLLRMVANHRSTPPAEFIRIYLDVLDGVQALHRSGVAHNDIKPDNVVVDAGGTAKLIDFGFSVERRIGSDENKVGTAWYAAPELLRSCVYNTFKADVWSLGILLFVVATGNLPFLDRDDVIDAIAKGRFVIPPDLDERIVRIFRAMTKHSPRERLTIEETQKILSELTMS
jgi:serine/threonine protein kinase